MRQIRRPGTSPKLFHRHSMVVGYDPRRFNKKPEVVQNPVVSTQPTSGRVWNAGRMNIK